MATGLLQAQIAPVSATLDVNNVRARINANGTLFTDFTRGQFVPIQPGLAEQPLIRSAGLWVMGRDQSGHLRGSVQVSGDSGQTDFHPGVLGAWPFNAISGVTCSDVQAHRSDWADNGVIDSPIDHIFGWPGFGNAFLEKYHPGFGAMVGSTQWWLNRNFIEETPCGRYEPDQGDYPSVNIRNCPNDKANTPEQMYWFPFTDIGPNPVSGLSPIGLQTDAQAFAYNTGGNSPLDRAVIVKMTVAHRGFDVLDSVYFGLHADFDLGNPNDDFMGSFSSPDMLFAYNGDADDAGGFGTKTPAVGAVLLRGPIVAGTDTLYVAPQRHAMILPVTAGLSAQGFYHILQGRFPDGAPAPNDGRMYPGDPTLPGGASEIHTGSMPGERVGVASFGPLRLVPGAVNEMIVAFFYSFEPGRSPKEQASRLIQEAGEIQEAFDNCFADIPTECGYVLDSRAPVLRQNALTAFPSPANTVLNVRSETEGLRSVRLMDAAGTTVLETHAGNSSEQVQLNTSRLPAGMYFLHAAFADQSVAVVRVVVQH